MGDVPLEGGAEVSDERDFTRQKPYAADWREALFPKAGKAGGCEHDDLDVSGDVYCTDCDDVNISRATTVEIFGHLLKGRLVQLRPDKTIRVIEVTGAEEICWPETPAIACGEGEAR